MNNLFQKNAGSIDRGLRIGVGALLLILAAQGSIGVWGFIGIVPLLTGFVGSCPVYSLLGVRTCKVS